MSESIELACVDLPFWTEDLPSCGGRLGVQEECFAVDEVPLYEPSGSGDHVYVRLQKRGRTTPQMIRAVAKAAGVKERDVGSAGMKDKHAVTSQWISLLQPKQPDPQTWELDPEYQVLECSRHGNKLRTGHLLGNRFSLQLVELVRPEAVAALVQRFATRGLPNFYGRQRFGQDGSNLPTALRWLEAGGGSAQGKKARFYNKLYPSVIQAEGFNRYVCARMKEGLDRLLEGEVVRLSGTGSMFRVEDVETEQPRLASGDVLLTGPMWGPKMRPVAAAALKLEGQVQEQMGLDSKALEQLGRWAPGTRRDLMVFPEGMLAVPQGAAELRLEFTLPAGSFATQVLREFCRDGTSATAAAEL